MEFCSIFDKQISFQNDVIVKKGYKQLVDKSNIEYDTKCKKGF